jgi:pantoate ligase/cytidylate kinase
MRVITTPAEMAALRQEWDKENPFTQLALVPTMGALHEGHGALCKLAKTKAERVVVSIFVNPLQFAANEDLDRYPRPKDLDLAQCEAWGMDAVYYPAASTMYPNGMEQVTRVIPPESLTNQLCGAARPGHFTGVATVVLLLMNQVRPDIAVFGEKDAQQVMVIRRMVQDLAVPVELLIHPVVREKSGLAMSSRNQYLKTAQQKEAALLLSKILLRTQEYVKGATKPVVLVRETLDSMTDHAVAACQSDFSDVKWKLQYLEAVDEESLEPATVLKAGTRLLIAAYVDDVRLIDTLLI